MIVERQLNVDVLTAARQRILNIFSNALPVYLSFSGGKDSLVLADMLVKFIQAGQVDPAQLRVQFIDEEAIFPCVEEIVTQWRARFMLLGVRFDWFCLEVKHFSCLNQLENDETFICWDRYKRDCWVRQPPPFAIRTHPNFQPSAGRTLAHGPRVDSYQTFLDTICDGPRMTGVRVFESIQRRDAISRQKPITDLTARACFQPIYDWQDVDVWRYLYENNVDIPAAYLHLYQVGVARRNLRISQFFSIDTAPALARMAEFYPGLMQRILRREPTAYLVSLYWDSEMFRRRTQRRQEIERVNREKGVAAPEARQRAFDTLDQIEQTAPPCPHERRSSSCPCRRCLARDVLRSVMLRPYLTTKHYEKIHDILVAGDPKRRSLRALLSTVRGDAVGRLAPDSNSTITITRAGDIGPSRPPRRPKAQSLQSQHNPRG